jgi:putative ABC transport system permease protein
LFGVLPAFGAATLDANEALRASGRGSTRGAPGVRDALVACEVALAFVLLIVVGLFGKSFAKVQAVTPGFATDHVLSARLALPPGRYHDRETIVRFQTILQERLSTLPTVSHAGSVSLLPLCGSSARVPFSVEGQPIDRQRIPSAQFRLVSAGYFEAMRIPLLRGRRFSNRDTDQTAPVAVVSETLAAQWLTASGDPIGMRLLVDDNDEGPRSIEVVGVVGNVRQMTLDGDPTLDLYLPYPQIHADTVGLAAGNMFLVIRTTGEAMAVARSLAQELLQVDPDVAAANVRPLESYLAGSVAPRRFSLVLLSVFGGAALVLAGAGLYAVVSYSVIQRAREMAIRIALGAQSTDIQRLVVGQGLRFATVGVVVAIPIALAVTRALGTVLFAVAPTDPATFAEVALAILFVAVVACAVPAARASRLRASPLDE